ncbi:MAG: EAL domain-containing protein [Planctomycetota bacterium]
MARPEISEKRRHGRYRPEGLRCNLGQVIDLSLGGMRVLSRRRLEGDVTVELRTPRQGPMSLAGRVTWCRVLGPREHVLGLTFEGLGEAEREGLGALVRDVSRGVDVSAVRGPRRRGWWQAVATSFLGVGLIGLGRLLDSPDPAWTGRLGEFGDTLQQLAPALRWVMLIGGGLLILAGLSDMLSAKAQARGPRADRRRGGGVGGNRPVVVSGPGGVRSTVRQSQHLLNCILESSLGGVGVLRAIRDKDDKRAVVDFEIQLINRAAENLIGRSESMLLGKRVSRALPCLMKHALFEDMTSAVRTGLPVQKEYRLDNGKWVQVAVVQLGDGLAVTFADTSEQHHAQARLRHVAYHDELTGLPNRKLLLEHVETALMRTQAKPRQHRFAVLFLDFDRFKIVNDTLGHEVGDMLLHSISQRLRENIRAEDLSASNGSFQLPARLGGDEFVVLLDGIRGEDDATAVAARLLETFSQPHQLGCHQVVSTASIGIVVGTPRYDTVDELIRDADTAMYEAKHSGKARYVVFDRAMHETLVEQSKLERDLREAVAAEDFTLVYEPIVCLESGAVGGYEALIRWEHGERGVVSPADFIPLAEELNIVVPIGEWVLREATLQLARWREMGLPDVFLNVNLSRAQLYDGDLTGVIRELIDTHDLDPERLSLEITETMVVNEVAGMAEKLHELKTLGVRLALDDFGTGQSSLNVLQELPLDILKIDRTFIANAGDAVRRYGAIIATITDLAKNLDMRVIAEGIERREQVALLQALDCDYAQGWLFSQALSADEAAALLAEGRVFMVAA